MPDINLGDRGLEPGDAIDPYMDLIDDGVRLLLPEGTYTQEQNHDNRYIRDFGIIGLGEGAVIETGDDTTRKITSRYTSGTYELRNLTFRGTGESGEGNGMWGSFSTTEGGQVVVDNCHWPDGTENRSDGHCMFVFGDHAGDILITNSSFQNFGDNAVYGSSPGKSGGGGGTVRVDHCFLKNNNVANVRLGTDGSYVRNSVLWQTGDAPLTASGQRHALQIKHRRSGDITVENCDLVFEGGDGATVSSHRSLTGGSVNMVNNRISHTGEDTVFNQNPAVEYTGQGNHYTGREDGSLPGGIWECINSDGCTPPDTSWPKENVNPQPPGIDGYGALAAGALLLGGAYAASRVLDDGDLPGAIGSPTQ